MTLHSENMNVLWGSLIIEELIRQGIDYFCLSPGSRSTPLTAAVARHPRARNTICYDERGAAFHALGYARGSGKPAVLICTSGTAVANYLPAVAEASIDRLPLIILSADRPPELHETGANQAFPQSGIFGEYVRWQFNFPCPDEAISPRFVLTTIDQAVYRATSPLPGPVHLNLPFREPLEPTPLPLPEDYLSPIDEWQNHSRPYTRYTPPERGLTEETIGKLQEKIAATRRGLFVVGRLKSESDRAAVRECAEKLGWPVLADIQSGLRMGNAPETALSYFDLLLLSPRFSAELQPETILHIGGPLTSKRFLQFIVSSSFAEYILVQNHPFREDPAHRVTWRLESDISRFCRRLSRGAAARIDPEWREALTGKSRQVGEMLDNLLAETNGLKEAWIARLLSRNIPAEHTLFLASSLPIREMDMFADPSGAAVPVAANRGVSGIDGTIASACGYAAGLNRPVTILIGDLALLHDLNSLSLIKSLSQPVIIVLLNNHGGGIFSFLPISKFKDIFEPYFGTPHNYQFKEAAKLFDLDYAAPSANSEFLAVYRNAAENGNSTLIELRTDRQENVILQQKIRQAIIDITEKR